MMPALLKGIKSCFTFSEICALTDKIVDELKHFHFVISHYHWLLSKESLLYWILSRQDHKYFQLKLVWYWGIYFKYYWEPDTQKDKKKNYKYWLEHEIIAPCFCSWPPNSPLPIWEKTLIWCNMTQGLSPDWFNFFTNLFR